MAMGKNPAPKKASETKADDKPETPESKVEAREAAASIMRSGDVVADVSRRADGTPDQSDDYKVIGE